MTDHKQEAEQHLTAAYPHIEAELRKQIAEGKQ